MHPKHTFLLILVLLALQGDCFTINLSRRSYLNQYQSYAHTPSQPNAQSQSGSDSGSNGGSTSSDSSSTTEPVQDTTATDNTTQTNVTDVVVDSNATETNATESQGSQAPAQNNGTQTRLLVKAKGGETVLKYWVDFPEEIQEQRHNQPEQLQVEQIGWRRRFLQQT